MKKEKPIPFPREYLGSAEFVNLDGKSEAEYLTEKEQREAKRPNDQKK